MVLSPIKLVEEFLKAQPERPVAITTESLPAPHRPYGLPTGKAAVYVFSLSLEAGARCPAGPNRVLKVGRAGPKSDARFRSQHYNPRSSGSNLAKQILRTKHLWRFLGIGSLDESSVAEWIKSNTDRDHFFVDAPHAAVLIPLEKFLRGRLGAVFEG